MGLADLNLVIKALDGASLVEVEGELSAGTSDAFEGALKEAAEGDLPMVVLDLTRVTSIDVGALRVLQRALEELGSDRKLCAVACGQTRRTLEMTRFDDVIGVYARLRDVPGLAQSDGPAALSERKGETWRV